MQPLVDVANSDSRTSPRLLAYIHPNVSPQGEYINGGHTNRGSDFQRNPRQVPPSNTNARVMSLIFLFMLVPVSEHPTPIHFKDPG